MSLPGLAPCYPESRFREGKKHDYSPEGKAHHKGPEVEEGLHIRPGAPPRAGYPAPALSELCIPGALYRSLCQPIPAA
jgi:hypothetical protein